MIQGWLQGELAPSATLQQHLDRCLLCRRCERVCPSKVQYGDIMDASRALWPATSRQRDWQKRLTAFIGGKYTQSGFALLRRLQQLGLLDLLRRSGLPRLFGMQRLLDTLPPLPRPFRPSTIYKVSGTLRGRIGLFAGCTTNALDPQTVQAAIRLLNRLGYEVRLPRQPGCCGALRAHDGEAEQAQQQLAATVADFNALGIDRVVSLVDGCSAHLSDTVQTAGFTVPVQDTISFLANIWPDNAVLQPLETTVALQIPCTLGNILRADDKLLTLLGKIPGIKLPPEAIYRHCCGAAGRYFLDQPLFADKLQQKALKVLTSPSPELIISSNLGCALHLRNGLRTQMQQIPVIHPIVLLEQQLST